METDEWRKILKDEFTKLMGEYLPFCYEGFTKQCLEIYGTDFDPKEAAKDQASYYD